MVVRLVLLGEPASKSNARRLVLLKKRDPRSGRIMTMPRLIKSQKALEYVNAALRQIQKPPAPLLGSVRVSARIFYATERPDLDASVILDVLQERVSERPAGAGAASMARDRPREPARGDRGRAAASGHARAAGASEGRMMRWASVCSGIGAPECAWSGIFGAPAFVAEIEPFPSAVLAHHYPGAPNLGDFTKIEAWHEPIELLVAGTPCQDFSTAGKRLGLGAPRGNLALEFLALARRLRARWIVFENVPGLLSNWSGAETDSLQPGQGREFVEYSDFAAFLGAVRECGYLGCWRILDAQYFHLAQRRERVFFVGHLGDWRRPAAVLLEPESLRGDPPPRREAREGIAGALDASAGGRDENDAKDGRPVAFGADHVVPTLTARRGTDFDCDGGLIQSLDLAYGLNANDKGGSGKSETFVTHSLRADGFDASEDGTGRGTPLVTCIIKGAAIGREPENGPQYGETLDDGSCPEQHAIAFTCKDHGADAGGIAPTLRGMSEVDGNANAGGQVAVALNWQSGGDQRLGLRPVTGAMQRNQTLSTFSDATVRRLTPGECEKLQGFPPGYTAIDYRGKPAADGPRYRALGNSMAVPCVRWLGQRIAMVDAITPPIEIVGGEG